MKGPRFRPNMASEMIVAITSVKVETGDNPGNLRHFINDFVVPAAKAKADLVMFPEMALSGYVQPEPGEGTVRDAFVNAETIPGPSTDAFLEAAKRYNIYICCGMTEADTRFLGILYNTQVLVGPEGVVGKHRKVSIEVFGKSDLARWGFAPGREIKVFELRNGWRVGIDICYDHWVPEIPRVLAVKGADLILNASAARPVYADRWPMVNSVRAIENTTGQVYSGLAGEYDGVRFFGGRMAVGPDGTVILPMEGTWDTEGMSYATFKAEDLYNARGRFPQLRDRIPEAYRVLVAPPLYPDL